MSFIDSLKCQWRLFQIISLKGSLVIGGVPNEVCLDCFTRMMLIFLAVRYRRLRGSITVAIRPLCPEGHCDLRQRITI
jgi:hypothetical protein